MMITVPFRKRQPFAKAAGECEPTLTLTDTDDYVMWCVCASRSRLACSDEEFLSADGSALCAAAATQLCDWHPALRQLVLESEVSNVFPVVYRQSEPVSRWRTMSATLLGDAIHVMPPHRGLGAATALCDAALLTRCLRQAVAGDWPLLQAVSWYEAKMLEDGFAAVANSVARGAALMQHTEMFA
jgi:2-polyprenyl-6-methoxyphenol hydroxylase-like FAD-dependent oxidoreductase